jgi:hypothetical protein
VTAQVAILTSSCAVLAADSAVTVSSRRGQKVYTGVEKIHPLSDTEPAAALVYGLASLLDVPWATLLSEFRHQYGNATYASMDAVSEQLIAFLQERLADRMQSTGNELRAARVRSLFAYIREEAREGYLASATESGGLDPDVTAEKLFEGITEYLKTVVTKERAAWQEADRVAGLTATSEKRLHRDHRAFVGDIRKEVFAGIAIPSATARALNDLALLTLTRQVPYDVSSPNQGGLVVVGFPESEFWPRFVEFDFDGLGLNGLRYWRVSDGGCDGPRSAFVRAFAQMDGVQTIMNGVHPDLLTLVCARLMEENVAEDQIERALDAASERWSKARTTPILDTLDVMPPPDLCEVAESLVAITALWQRMLGTLETVGGTISVGVLSPGEPLRWAKRPSLAPK